MKRNLLAIAIPALLVAAGANASIEVWNKDGNKVDFYGRVKAANRITDRNQVTEGDKTTARFGMSGQTQVTDSVTGYGRWEHETKTGKGSWDETRYAFAGLNFGDYGSFDYGRNDGVLKALTAYTDVLADFGGDAANNKFHVLSARTKAVATYRNNNFFGLTDDLSFALQYADNGDNSATEDSKRDNSTKEAWGANVQWRIFDTGLTAGAGYAQTSGSKNDANTWSAGIKYDNYNLYLAANYFQSKLKDRANDIDGKGWSAGSIIEDKNELPSKTDIKIKGVELVAQYGIDLDVGRLTPSIGYVQHKRTFDDGYTGLDNALAKYVAVGATWKLNKNFTTLVEYKINLLDKDDVGAKVNSTKESGKHPTKPGTKDNVAIGLIYQF